MVPKPTKFSWADISNRIYLARNVAFTWESPARLMRKGVEARGQYQFVIIEPAVGLGEADR